MTAPEQGAIINADKRAAIDSLFQNLPSGFEERHIALKEIRDEFHTRLARVFEPALNEYAQRLPQETYDEKSKVASTVNGLLRSVGLTLCHNGLPAILVVDTQDASRPDVSRFRFEVRDEEGRAKRRGSKQFLLPLTLMPDHPRKAFWEKRLQQRDQEPFGR